MVWRTAWNPGDTPVVTSRHGHSLGGHEWGPVETTEPCVRRAIEDGALIIQGEPSGDTALDPAALTAGERAARYADRSKQMSKLSVEELRAIAVAAGLAGGDEVREELEERLLDSPVSLVPPDAEEGDTEDEGAEDGADEGAADGADEDEE